MSSSTVLHDCVVEFMECLVHQLLAMRDIYPSHLFERSTKYGISLWQCRHPEVSSYILRVLNNARPALEQNLIDQYLFATYDASDQPVDHISINCNVPWTKPGRNSTFSDTDAHLSTPEDFARLESDLRGIILGMQCQLGRTNKTLRKYLQTSRWELLLVLKPTPCIESNNDNGELLDANEVAAVDGMLRGGEWREDNSQLTRQLVADARNSTLNGSSSNSNNDYNSSTCASGGSGPVVMPLCSLQNNRFLSLQIISTARYFAILYKMH